MVEIIPTCVPTEATDLSRGADAIRSFAPAIHIDIDDEIFAPVRTWPYTSAGIWEPFDIAGANGLPAEVHLMVQEPREIGITFAQAGAFRIIGHIEAFSSEDDAQSTLSAWKRSGASEVGLGILKATPFEVIEPLVSVCDVVHMMSIATIGTQGIPYDGSAPARIAEFHARFPETLISVDGGVALSNIADLVRAGARRFGIGAAIAKAPSPEEAYRALVSLAEGALQ